jgi:tetratricopeptide (TPR) repeat protein
LGVLLSAACPARALPPQDYSSSAVRVEASPQLFTTVGALFAAGYGGRPDVSGTDPLVERFRTLKGPAVDALRHYFLEHSSADARATASQYVTFALIAGPPPNFDLKLRREELPPEVLALDGFREALANFYQEEHVEDLWREFQPRYEQSQAQLVEPLTRAVLLTSGYLREVVSPERRFTVYVEPLLGGQIHVRNIGYEYALVVNPSVDLRDEMRHAFLHFLLDPVVIRYQTQLLPEDVLFRMALRAPRLPQGLRKDSLAFFAECLVQAVELRMRKLPAAQLAQEVDRADGDGLVLIRPLMPALAKFEAAEPAMSFYFPDLLKSIDPVAERSRLQSMRFPPADEPPAAAAPPLSEKDQAIEEGDRLTASRDAAGAAAAYQRALAIAPQDPRALYGYAVASLLLNEAERAFDLFGQVVSAATAADPSGRPDAATLAWAHVYLGRLHDLAGERDEAVREYHSALAVADAPEAALAAAQAGGREAYRPAARNPPPG